MKKIVLSLVLAAMTLTTGCTTREALIGTGAAVAGAAVGAYAGNNYDVDVDKRDKDDHDHDHH